MPMYTIYDKSAEEAGPVFDAVNDAIAIRNTVRTLLEIPPHISGDYVLYRVGDWDNKSMVVCPCAPFEIDIYPYLAKAYKYKLTEESND